MNVQAKNYAFIIIPQKDIGDQIEHFRVKQSENKLIDGLEPHVTFKRRFTLANGFSENDLKEYLQNIKMDKVKISFNKAEILGNALTLVGESVKLREVHKKVLSELDGKVITKNPEWEGDGFKIHMTLLRNPKDINTEGLHIRDVLFEKLCLYEIDPASPCTWANEISCRKLD